MLYKKYSSWREGNSNLPKATLISVVYKSLNNKKILTLHNCLLSDDRKYFIDSNNVMTLRVDTIIYWCPTLEILEFNNYSE